jgi:hypothetical protein
MKRDLGIGEDSHGNNINACLKLVDKIIINEGTRHDLETELEETLSRFGLEGNHGPKEKD